MKIYEITEKNSSWLVFTGNDTDFEKEFSRIVYISKMLIHLRRKAKYQDLLELILEFEDKVDRFLQTSFPDQSDEDILHKKKQLLKIKSDLNEIKQQLK